MLVTDSRSRRPVGRQIYKTENKPTQNFAPEPKPADLFISTATQALSSKPGSFPESLDQEVIDLTRRLVQVDSTPSNIPHGENAVVDVAVDYATKAGLEISRTTTVNDRPMLIVSLPGKNPDLGSVGFVHHSDVVSIEGEWKTCLLYTSPSPRDRTRSRMPSSA